MTPSRAPATNGAIIKLRQPDVRFGGETPLPALLEVRNLRTEFRTGAGTVRAVDGISYSVDPGETVAVVGESGSGKSVGALSILRLIPNPPGRIAGGEVMFAGRDLMQLSDDDMREVRGGEIGMVFQEPMTSLNPVLTIGRQITEMLEQHRGADRAAASGARSSCWVSSASPTRSAGSSNTRISCRAACGSAS